MFIVVQYDAGSGDLQRAAGPFPSVQEADRCAARLRELTYDAGLSLSFEVLVMVRERDPLRIFQLGQEHEAERAQDAI